MKVRQEVGYALHLAQTGEKYQNTKPFTGYGPGVYEIVSDYDKNAYRAVYVANIGNTIYVLHCFQKKSKRGIKTPKEEFEVIKRRLKFVRETVGLR